MTIAFTGGGTGGHFYPIIAIAEAMNDIITEDHLLPPILYYLAPDPFDSEALFANGIAFVRVPAGKVRRYFSLMNVLDFFVTCFGTLYAVFTLFRLYPDVIVSKGGYGSVPTVLAARLLRIPVVIHESDAKPGRANLMASRFAEKIAISFGSAAAYFPKKAQSKIARTGIPIRKALLRPEAEGAVEHFGLEKDLPTILIMGGSQGSVKINETVISALPHLISFANVIHQTGQANFKEVKAVAEVMLGKDPHANRYHPVHYLSEMLLQRAANVATLIISRAGANSIAEIGLWKKPAIIIPIPESVSHDQRSNAYAYAETGAAIVIEEGNLSSNLLVSEIQRVINDPKLMEHMSMSSKDFTDPDAARVIAHEVLAIAISHES